MATRKPIVQNSGDFQQLQSADTLPSSIFGGGSTDGQVVKQQSSVPAWVDDVEQVTAIFNGAGSAITAGGECEVIMPYAGTISQVTILLDVSGSIVVDVWKAAYASYPPVVGNSIVASAPPTVSGATKSQDTTLTGWTKTFAAGDVLKFHVNSASTATRATVMLKVTKS